MALKPGTKAYNEWRKKNFDLSIKVPESTIQKLRDGKTPQNNINRFAGTNDKLIREAMNRFYGKGWESKAKGGKGGSTTPAKPNKPSTKPSAPMAPGKPYRERNDRFSAQGNPGRAVNKAKPRMVPVTSVTPNIKVKAVGKAQQERTRAMVGDIAMMAVPGALAIKAGRAISAGVKAANVAKGIKAEQAAVAAAKASRVSKAAATRASNKAAQEAAAAARSAAAKKAAATRAANAKKAAAAAAKKKKK